MTPEVRTPVSVDEFWRLASRFPKAELVGGQVIELVPPGVHHGVLALAMGRRLHEYVAEGGLGVVMVEAGFVLSRDPPTVRVPDVAVVLRERVPSPLPAGFFPGAPDLAVEVLSPDERPTEIAAKVADYLRAGAQAVWVLDPEDRTMTVHTRQSAVTYSRTEVLRGAPPLPGLELRLQVVFTDI
ncbi:MAG: Uma2 family endonuclease [Armatimonadota bacterium]|nr:Uma2 family endonuclease [Armatimonadota bacterium]